MKETPKRIFARRLIILFFVRQSCSRDLSWIDPSDYQEDIKVLKDKDLIQEEKDEIKLTEKGRKLVDLLPYQDKRDIKRFYFWFKE